MLHTPQHPARIWITRPTGGPGHHSRQQLLHVAAKPFSRKEIAMVRYVIWREYFSAAILLLLLVVAICL